MFNRKNTISFFTESKFDHLEKIYPSYQNFPEWFSKSNKKTNSKCPFVKVSNKISNVPMFGGPNPLSLIKETGVTNCPGIVDYLKTGYILPAWCDFSFRKIQNRVIFDASYPIPQVQYAIHDKDHYLGMDENQLPKMGGFNKVASPWWIKTSPGTSVMILDPFWNRNKNFTSVSAIVHPDIVPINLKWFFEFNKSLEDNPDIYDPDLQLIKKGTPLLLMVPFKRNKFVHKFEYVSGIEMEKLSRSSTYNTLSWISETVYNKFRKTIGNLYK
jgi:hypothetical protein